MTPAPIPTPMPDLPVDRGASDRHRATTRRTFSWVLALRNLAARTVAARILAVLCVIGVAVGGGVVEQQGSTAWAQTPSPFQDTRRLPDLDTDARRRAAEAEARRKAEDQQRAAAEAEAQRKSEQQQRAATEAEARRRAEDQQRAAAEAEAQRKSEQQRAATESEAKRKAEQQRAAAEAETKRKADEQQRLAAEAEAKRKADEQQRLAAEADAKRRAEEQQRAAAEADAKRKAEQQRLAAEAESKRKADEQQRLAAEADAKRKAEQQRLAAEADAKRKADEQQRLAAEADAKRKADEQQRVAAEAEAKRKADVQRRAVELEALRIAEEKRFEEAEARRKADDERRLAAQRRATAAAPPLPSAASPTPPPPALVPPQTAALLNSPPGGPCEPLRPKVEPLPAGLMRIEIDSPCRRGQSVTIGYGELTLVRKLDPAGRGTITVDLVLGPNESLSIKTADGKQETLPAVMRDAGEVSKVAIIWQKPTDIDLHATEGNAPFGAPGHVWSGAARTAAAAFAQSTSTQRGVGFLSSASDGTEEGAKVEVYTFVHHPEQTSGAVPFLIDHVSRGAQPSAATCGSGALAEVPYDVIILQRNGDVLRESGIIPSIKCGEALPVKARYLRNAVPDLRFRR